MVETVNWSLKRAEFPIRLDPGGAARRFTWQASGDHGVNGTLKVNDTSLGWYPLPGQPAIETQGLCSVFHFFDRAQHRTARGPTVLLE